MPTDYVKNAIYSASLADKMMRSTKRKSEESDGACVGFDCLAARCILLLVTSTVDVSHIDLTVNCATGGVDFGLRVCIARSIETTFSILSLSTLIMCEVFSINRNLPTDFRKSFDCSSSAIISSAFLQ